LGQGRLHRPRHHLQDTSPSSRSGHDEPAGAARVEPGEARRVDQLAALRGVLGLLIRGPIADARVPRHLRAGLAGIWIALEAWADQPPPIFIIENVPRIASRGRAWLDKLAKLFSHYGYAWRESSHDCGELGHLAQHRRRFLGVARHRQQVPEFLYEPPKRRVRGVGEVLASLPIPLPGSTAGGPMHTLPRLSALNWLRLAAIEAGKDWSALPAQIQLGCKPRSGVFGVQPWDKPSACVVGEARPDNGSWAIADPRSICARRAGALGVTPWNKPVHAIIGAASIQNTGLQVADPRILNKQDELPHQQLAYATHQLILGPDGPRLLGEQMPNLDDKRPIHLLIMAPDNTLHRPTTTMELAAFQGFEVLDDEGVFLCLTGNSHAAWRKRIGNAVPPPAAAAIADSCRRTLDACNAGGLLLSGEPIWVQPSRHHIPPLILGELYNA
jgi:site-specific DNA-cytosine methylase